MSTELASGLRFRAQPRPWHAGRTLTSNADVIEVVAEYACGSVAEACSLRRATTAWRRAVDTVVRRLVYADAPTLRHDRRRLPSRDIEHDDLTVLITHSSSAHMFACRVAFASDRVVRIQRLVVVAFALDGPKDELHEAEECGDRDLYDPEQPLVGLPLLSKSPRHQRSRFLWDAVPRFLRPAIERCLYSLAVDVSLLPDVACTATGGCNPWPRLRTLSVFGRKRKQSDSLDPLLCFLRLVGPQLTELSFAVMTAANAAVSVLPLCSKLTLLSFPSVTSPTVASSKALSDAVIASRAPLQTIRAPLTSRDALRMLTAIPTIVRASAGTDLTPADLPEAIAERMSELGDEPMPAADDITVSAVDEWRPSERVRCLYIGSDPAMLRVASDVASTFPKLWHLIFEGATVDAAYVDRVRLPPSLRMLRVDALRPMAPLCAALANHGAAHLSHLSVVEVGDYAADLDISPLVVFASTLTILRLRRRARKRWTGDELARCEATLAQLVNLRSLEMVALPTPRCTFGGRHSHLRQVFVANANTRSAPFSTLLKACPELVRAFSATLTEAFAVPNRWVVFNYCTMSQAPGMMASLRSFTVAGEEEQEFQ